MQVRRVKKTQFELAAEIGISRQALSNHLRKFREMGLVSQGREFIDLSEDVELFLNRRGSKHGFLQK